MRARAASRKAASVSTATKDQPRSGPLPEVPEVREGAEVSDAGAAFSSPRSLKISMRRSASSRRAWQKRDSSTPRSYSARDCSRVKSPSSSFLTIDSSSAIAASKPLIDVSEALEASTVHPHSRNQLFVSRTSQSSSPRASVTRTRSPRPVCRASRMMAVRSAFQQTAYPRPRTASGLRTSSRPANSRRCRSAR